MPAESWEMPAESWEIPAESWEMTARRLRFSSFLNFFAKPEESFQLDLSLPGARGFKLARREVPKGRRIDGLKKPPVLEGVLDQCSALFPHDLEFSLGKANGGTKADGGLAGQEENGLLADLVL